MQNYQIIFITFLISCFYIISTFFLEGFAQKKSLFKQPYELDISYHHSYILNHQQNVGHLINSHPWGIDVSYYFLKDGSQGWESSYKYPKVGISLTYLDFMSDILGESISITPNMKFSWRKRQNSNLEFKIGAGISYITNPWDLESNPKNTMISDEINFTMRAGLIYSHKIMPKLYLRTGLDFIHFSNAAFTLPNAGTNIPTFNFGLYYVPSDYNFPLIDSVKNVKKEYYLQASLMMSWIERLPAQGFKNPIYAGSISLNKRVGLKSVLQAGIDYSYSTMIQDDIEVQYANRNETKPSPQRYSLFIGHEWWAGRVALLTQIGFYVYRPYNEIDAPLYQRLGVRVALDKDFRFLGNFSMKTHYGAAECVEWGIAYNFYKFK